MKKSIFLLLALVLILSALLSTSLTSCNNANSDDGRSFSDAPFFAVKEGEDPLPDNKIRSVISRLPADKYEKYPHLHSTPLTATLYKDGKEIALDLKDQRVIRILNFYNNSVYYNNYAYTQGLLDKDLLEEKVFSEDARLVLTFTPNKDSSFSYDTNIEAYDTIVVTNGQQFVLLGHELPGYEGAEDQYPFSAVRHDPLFNDYRWLDLFGF